MQVIIPMSGFGERFRAAGYSVPKPLIPVDGRPMITHVIDLFPGATKILFICNRDHLAEPRYRMAETIRDHHSSARIVAIAPHTRGPIHAVLEASGEIDPGRPTIVNYCDFSCEWDFADFSKFVVETDCDGAIPAYRGFHPHSLGSTYYAYLRESGLWAKAIQEKRPFTDNPTQEFASSGAYYFRSGAMMLDYFRTTVERNINVHGEYYVSLAYVPMFEDGRRIAIYELQHFLQWGTPEDLEEYQAWSNLFEALTKRPPRACIDGLLLMPMAGAGQRYADAGYATPKPLVEVSGRPMVIQAALDLPQSPRSRFVLRRDLPGISTIKREIAAQWPGADFVTLVGLTEGQAVTCLMGLEGISDDEPVVIGACDNGLIYDPARVDALMRDPLADIVAFGVRSYPAARRLPQSYGWIAADATGAVREVSVKRPLADPRRDPIITGAFIFKRAADFRRTVDRMVHLDRRINGEFYIDECLNVALDLGLKVRLLEVDHYIGWGTPNELRTFEYWQSCFHKLVAHPYRLQRDPRLAPGAAATLEARYAPKRAARPSQSPVSQGGRVAR